MCHSARVARVLPLVCLVIGSLSPGCAGGGDATLPPGASAREPQLVRRLEAALAARGDEYVPRTQHLNPDGSPRWVNRLILESSPYLIQHAHNPVDWYPWGDEAFDRARREGKPVLLSVGYSTCHWCHVMERESFEDEEIARVINERFVAIKVDREERPDVDDIYMRAVQMMTGRGGWPMTVLLTPDREPFFGGTYFPARDGDRGARIGFLTILNRMAQSYADDRDSLVARAQEISGRVRAASAPQAPGDVPGADVIERAVQSIAGSFDAEWGGFGQAPKFPRPATLGLLLRYHRRTGDPAALEMVTRTIEKMAAGGIHDQVGGGFHRYSTDARWLVPHFEKMLYDSAQLVPIYLAAYQLTGRDEFARVATETLRYVEREMTAPAGAFYSATDADSPGPSGHDEEGYYFTWTPAELEAALGADDARLVSAVYGVTAAGNFEGRNILFRPRALEDVAAELDMKPAPLRRRLDAARDRLYEVRSRRPAPPRDEKILTSWNGLMISAFARAALVLDRRDYAERAERAAGFVVGALSTDERRLLRSFTDGTPRHNAYLDDYADLIQGLLDLYEATSMLRWLDEAVALQGVLDRHYRDAEHGGYFLTSDDHETLLARDRPLYDGAEPSGNSVAVQNLLRLAEYTSRDEYRTGAERALAAFAGPLTRSPTASPNMLSALEAYLDTPLEVFVVTPERGGDAAALMARFRSTYLPNRVFTLTAAGALLAERARAIPALAGKSALSGRTTAFVCERGYCELPTSDPEVFARQLAVVHPLVRDGAATPAP